MNFDYEIKNGKNTSIRMSGQDTVILKSYMGDSSSSYIVGKLENDINLNISITSSLGHGQELQLFYYYGIGAPRMIPSLNILGSFGWRSLGKGSVFQLNMSNGRYFGIAVSNIGNRGNITYTIDNFPSPRGNTVPVCVAENTFIRMEDESLKPIQEIARGDLILSLNRVERVARITSQFRENSVLYKINDELICTEHPIVCNNGKFRIFPEHIPGIERVEYTGYVYNIQFENEGYFFVGEILLDSLSPLFCNNPLPQELYFDEEKYTEYRVENEDDPIRQKPPMTDSYENLEYS